MKKSLIIFALILSLTLSFQNIFSQGKNMRLLGKLNPMGTVTDVNYSALWGYLAPDGREYAILGGLNGTYFIDVTDSTNIHQIAFLPSVQSQWREIKTYSHYAYIVSEGDTSGIQIVDLANLPASIRYVGKYTPPNYRRSHTIQQEGPYLYVNGANPEFGDGTAIIDLSVNPEQPVLRGKWTQGYVHDSRVINDTLWTAGNVSFDPKIFVINAANKDNLIGVANTNNGPSSYPHNIAVSPGRMYMYVSDESTNPPGKLKIWNVQNFSNVLLLHTWTPSSVFRTTISHNVEIYGNKLLVAYYTAGVKLLDVSNPASPVELGWYDTYPGNNAAYQDGCWAVYMLPSGKIIASDQAHGLYVLRYAPPQNAKPAAELMTDKSVYITGDSVQFVDCSTNNPSDFQWTITGSQNLYSTAVNPKIKITGLGYFTVKLRVSNSFGADSVIKTNCFKVNGSPMTAPVFSAPFVQTIITNRNDTSKVMFTWSNASPVGVNITYKFRIRKNGETAETYYASNNNGTETSITFAKGKLDSIAHQLGFSGDSVVTVCRVTAYNGLDSIQSGNNLLVTLKSTSVGIQNISSQIPDAYKLENNYPNPFNPSTNIKFQLPKNSFVQLIIYDMLGREVMKLLNEELNAGYYNYQFDAGSLNSGIYFYKLTTNNFSETKRMVLVK